MVYDAIIVGGGAAGLTTAAYLCKGGFSTLLLEQQQYCGGLVNSFTRDGFTFDGGVRALDNAGALFPMLKQLGIDLNFIENKITLGIEDHIMHVESDDPFQPYQDMLEDLYPESKIEISQIIEELKQITHYMDIQYGIDNPLFLDIKKDRDYFMRKVFPWMFKYLITVPKVSKKNVPVVPYLEQFTQNRALLDIITQHFFADTPAFFALSYFKLYQEYFYPEGGTGTFSRKLVEFIQNNGGEIKTSQSVVSVDLENKTVMTADDQVYAYRQLCWAADQKTLYQMISTEGLNDPETVEIVRETQTKLDPLVGNDSVLTLYLSTSLPPEYFSKISAGHFFYTPSRKGQSIAGPIPRDGTWEEIQDWLTQFFALTTYEISIPVLRDRSLAPEGKTGLIISALFDYTLTKHVYDQGWKEQFQQTVGGLMLETLEGSVYPGLQASVIDQFMATPVTIQKMTGNTDGAITGWSFTNPIMPAESRLVKIASAAKTPLPDVSQAGQWTYSPSGFPVALITGKLASDRMIKQLK
jgi:phytoene dehydrogenase-like protein